MVVQHLELVVRRPPKQFAIARIVEAPHPARHAARRGLAAVGKLWLRALAADLRVRENWSRMDRVPDVALPRWVTEARVPTGRHSAVHATALARLPHREIV